MKTLNLLSRSEMKKVTGGVAATGGWCRITLYDTDGSGIIDATHKEFPGATCAQQQANANAECVTWVNAERGCMYNCGCDGWEN